MVNALEPVERWAGRIVRMKDGRLPKRAATAKREGHGKRGRKYHCLETLESSGEIYDSSYWDDVHGLWFI